MIYDKLSVIGPQSHSILLYIYSVHLSSTVLFKNKNREDMGHTITPHIFTPHTPPEQYIGIHL